MTEAIQPGTPSQSDDRRPVDPPLDPERAWTAVLARDKSRDGRFVFAVATTGIYCRPSCAARRPKRENVRFFSTPAEAAAAGFRACKRCRPDEPPADPAKARARAARDHLEAHLDETVTLAELAAVVGGSPHHLQRTFKRCFGVSPKQYVNARRLERFRRLVREEGSVTDAVYEAGFVDGSQLYGQAGERLGMTPGRFRDGGVGVTIRYATADSPVGRLLVAATERGLCAVRLGDGDAEVEEALRREFPRATLQPAPGELGPWIEDALARIEGETPPTLPPLDVQATAFQRRVWEALCAIPRGAVRTYGQVAAAVGRPRAARAVARACATNPVAVVVPCHRVVAAGGGLGGYRWGRERKEKLLAREGASGEHG
jgi:AraC family transcriptional regulator of adaptative response/methylated-DNA-[protein]-cysteine methyltransferase